MQEGMEKFTIFYQYLALFLKR